MKSFSGCGSYHNDTSNYKDNIAIQYVLDELMGGMTAFTRGYGILLYIIRLDKTSWISLKTVRGVQLSIVRSLLTLI